MNGNGSEGFERELQKLSPARVPEELMTRLTASIPRAVQPVRMPPPVATKQPWWRLPGWLIPAVGSAAAMLALAAWLWRPHQAPLPNAATKAPQTAKIFKADAVEIDRELLGSYETVATLGVDGPPIRFSCQQWQDTVVFKDNARGLVVERRVPRLEVVPVKLDTY